MHSPKGVHRRVLTEIEDQGIDDQLVKSKIKFQDILANQSRLTEPIIVQENRSENEEETRRELEKKLEEKKCIDEIQKHLSKEAYHKFRQDIIKKTQLK